MAADLTGLPGVLADPQPAAAHVHAQSDVTGLVSVLNGKQDASAKGQANGYAGLGADGKVPSAQLPDSQGGGTTLITAVQTGSVSTGANTTPVNVPGCVFTFEANGIYLIELVGLTQAAATTTGSGFQIDTSVAVGLVSLTFYHQLANAGTVTGGSSITDDASVGVSSGRPAANVAVPVAGSGVLYAGANGGTAQLRFRSEVAAVATCLGCILRAQKVA